MIPRPVDVGTRVRLIGSSVMIIMGTITVYREYGIPLGRQLMVFVDGVLVTGLRSESAVDITVDEGPHAVHIALDWQASAPVHVDVEDGERVTLRARVDLRSQSFTAVAVRPHEALDLDVMPLRPPVSEARTAHVRLDGVPTTAVRESRRDWPAARVTSWKVPVSLCLMGLVLKIALSALISDTVGDWVGGTFGFSALLTAGLYALNLFLKTRGSENARPPTP